MDDIKVGDRVVITRFLVGMTGTVVRLGPLGSKVEIRLDNGGKTVQVPVDQVERT